MIGRAQLVGMAAAVCMAAALGACAAVNGFAPAAIDYNLQAEQIKNQMILLNIVRAAYRKPMQFSDFTTVTGVATASVTAGFAVPFLTIPGSLARTFAAAPSGTLSGGPNFTVSILNTKEFYSGITAPISMQLVTLYLRQGFPREMLLTLLLSDIEYKKNGEAVHGYNVANPVVRAGEQFIDFRKLLRSLIERGLDAEGVEETVPVGPPLAAKDAASLGTLAALPQDQSLAKHDALHPDPNLSPAERAELAAKRVGTYYRLEKKRTVYRFCFDANSARAGEPIADTGLVMNAALVCGAAGPEGLVPGPVQPAKGAPQQIHTLVFGPIAGAAPPGASAAGAPQELNMTTRSVEQLIYYLGEIARGELGLTGSVHPCPVVAAGGGPVCLFQLRAGPAPPAAIATAYDGRDYAILVDPAGADRSSQVMALVSQLLSLNNSAKDLPAPSVISVIH